MKKHLVFTLPFFVAGLLLLPPGASQANIAPKKISHIHSVKQSGIASRATSESARGKGKKKVAKKSTRLAAERHSAGRHKVAGKFVKHGRCQVTFKERKGAARGHVSEAMPSFADVPDIGALRQQYQEWRGTRYRSGGSSHAGVDCSGFTALTFRDVYGIQLPRTAREQAMQGISVGRGNLQPGDLVFFKRGQHGDHVGIYLGDGKFMHASSHMGVTISSLSNVYWRDKFWKGARLL